MSEEKGEHTYQEHNHEAERIIEYRVFCLVAFFGMGIVLSETDRSAGMTLLAGAQDVLLRKS